MASRDDDWSARVRHPREARKKYPLGEDPKEYLAKKHFNIWTAK